MAGYFRLAAHGVEALRSGGFHSDSPGRRPRIFAVPGHLGGNQPVRPATAGPTRRIPSREKIPGPRHLQNQRHESAHGVGTQHVGQWVNPSGPSRYGRNVHASPSRGRSVLGLRPALARDPAWHCRISTTQLSGPPLPTDGTDSWKYPLYPIPGNGLMYAVGAWAVQ